MVYLLKPSLVFSYANNKILKALESKTFQVDATVNLSLRQLFNPSEAHFSKMLHLRIQ
jgi:hypothetical protein